MFHYRYIGADDFLTGETALGQEIDGVFKVQVDRIEHPWAHGWHETPREQWDSNLNPRAANDSTLHPRPSSQFRSGR